MRKKRKVPIDSKKGWFFGIILPFSILIIFFGFSIITCYFDSECVVVKKVSYGYLDMDLIRKWGDGDGDVGRDR